MMSVEFKEPTASIAPTKVKAAANPDAPWYGGLSEYLDVYSAFH
jgi:hypothetical protein